MRVQVKEEISLVFRGKDYSRCFTRGRSYLVLAKVEIFSRSLLRWLRNHDHCFEIMDDVCGDPGDVLAAPDRFPVEWFDVVDDDQRGWITEDFTTYRSQKMIMSGCEQYVCNHSDEEFFQRMRQGCFPDLAMLRLVYPPSTWHSDRVGINDSIEMWMEEFIRT